MHVREQDVTQVPLTENDNVVKTPPSNRTDEPFSIYILCVGMSQRYQFRKQVSLDYLVGEGKQCGRNS